MKRDNLELIILAVLTLVCIVGVVGLTLLSVPIPELLIGLMSLIVGAFLKEIGESGQLAKQEKILGGFEIERAS